MRIFVLLAWIISTFSSAQELLVIANAKFPQVQLNEHQVKQIFLKRTHYINGVELFPINLSSRHELRKYFEIEIIKMSTRQLRQHWTKAHYQGKRPPLVRHSIESILAFVRKVDGAIAYIPSSNISSDLKILYKVDK